MVSDEYLEKTVMQIRARMRHIASHLPPDAFDAMVLEMARLQVKYEQHAGYRPAGPPDDAPAGAGA